MSFHKRRQHRKNDLDTHYLAQLLSSVEDIEHNGKINNGYFKNSNLRTQISDCTSEKKTHVLKCLKLPRPVSRTLKPEPVDSFLSCEQSLTLPKQACYPLESQKDGKQKKQKEALYYYDPG